METLNARGFLWMPSFPVSCSSIFLNTIHHCMTALLKNLFWNKAPLHDGAVIVRRNRVAAATCFLPLTDSNEVSMELGTRHRAAIGASEVSDAYVIVVSEETGAISLARGGVLYRDLSPEQLKNMISQPRKEGSKKTFATIWKGRQEKE